MTAEERRKPQISSTAAGAGASPLGSGTTVQDVNKLMKQYEQMQRMMKTLGKGGAEHGRCGHEVAISGHRHWIRALDICKRKKGETHWQYD